MNKTIPQFFREEYDFFREALVSDWAIDEQHFNKFDAQLKPIHKRYLSLACAATVIGYRGKRNEYIQGVVEASYLCLVLTLKGLENPTCVLLRQSIELILKHIYFFTHPVEYEWACIREDYRDLTFQTLLEYLTRTNQCQKFDPCNDISVKLNELFGVLSRHVHVHSRAFIGYSRARSKYQPEEELIRKLEERTKALWPLLAALLIIYFPKRYFKASAMEQKIMKHSLPRDLRKHVDQYLFRCT